MPDVLVLPPHTPVTHACTLLPDSHAVARVQSGARTLGVVVAADCHALQAFGVESCTVRDIMLPPASTAVTARTTRAADAQPAATLQWADLGVRLGTDKTALLHALAEIAASHDTPLFLVGGVVRAVFAPDDALVDLDVAVAGSFAVFLAAVVQQLGATITQQSPFNTATVALPPHEAARYGVSAFDIVGLRTEQYTHIGALPTVTPTDDICADVQRRDLTINAMALHVSLHGPLALYDPYDGRGDLQARRAVFLHPVSLFQDPTRLVRLARLVARLGLQVPPETTRQIRAALKAGVLQHVSHHRWLVEWQRCADEPRFYEMVVLLQAWGIRILLPGMLKARRGWCAAALSLAPEYRLSALFWHIPERFLARLLPEWPELPSYVSSLLILRAERFAYHRWERAPAPMLVERLEALTPEALQIVAALEPTFAPVAARYHHITTQGALLVTGADLIAAGYQPGPAFGLFLSALQRHIYADVEQTPRRLMDKQAQLAFVLAALHAQDMAFVQAYRS